MKYPSGRPLDLGQFSCKSVSMDSLTSTCCIAGLRRKVQDLRKDIFPTIIGKSKQKYALNIDVLRLLHN